MLLTIIIKFGFSVPDYPISPLKPRFWDNFQLTFNSAYPKSGQTNEQTNRLTENNCNLRSYIDVSTYITDKIYTHLSVSNLHRTFIHMSK